MKKRSKKYRSNAEIVPIDKVYSVEDGIQALAKLDIKKEETVALSIRLGIEPKKADQNVRGSYSLPKGIGRSLKVVVFAEGAKAKEAAAAGADEVGSEELAKKIKDGWMDFDVVIASPDQMKHVGKLGRILGPQGKMPTPKTGTVTQNIGKTVAEYKAGKIEFRNDKEGNLHVIVGRCSFSGEDLGANIKAFLTHLNAIKPIGVKGTFVKSITLSSTQSPGISLAV